MDQTLSKKINYSVGKNIRSLRQQRNWSQADVAHQLGISVPAFSKIEIGLTDINLSRLVQIANIYEINVIHLFSMEIDENEEAKPKTVKSVTDQNKFQDNEQEIANLQRKVILLYEELRSKIPFGIQ